MWALLGPRVWIRQSSRFFCALKLAVLFNNDCLQTTNNIMTYISTRIFSNPFPSLDPHFQCYNNSVDAQKPYSYYTNSPLQENVIVYVLSWRAMKVRMANTLCSIAKWMRELLRFISLLFGMCSSQTCYIRDAFCGTTLYRFPLIYISLLSCLICKDRFKIDQLVILSINTH